MTFVNLVAVTPALCLVVLGAPGAEGQQRSEIAAAEDLSRLGCRLAVRIEDGVTLVYRVDGSGRVGKQGLVPMDPRLFEDLRSLPHLSELKLDFRERDRPYLASITSLKSLRSLEISGKDLDNAAARALSSLTALESLILWDVSVADSGLASITNLNHLTHFEISTFDKLTEAGLFAVSTLPNLQYFRINATYDPESLRSLVNAHGLRRVVVSGRDMDAKISALAGSQTIEWLRIVDAQVGSPAALNLQKMRNLTSLELERCELTTQAAQEIGDLRLNRLSCSGMDSRAIAQLAARGGGWWGSVELLR